MSWFSPLVSFFSVWLEVDSNWVAGSRLFINSLIESREPSTLRSANSQFLFDYIGKPQESQCERDLYARVPTGVWFDPHLSRDAASSRVSMSTPRIYAIIAIAATIEHDVLAIWRWILQNILVGSWQHIIYRRHDQALLNLFLGNLDTTMSCSLRAMHMVKWDRVVYGL